MENLILFGVAAFIAYESGLLSSVGIGRPGVIGQGASPRPNATPAVVVPQQNTQQQITSGVTAGLGALSGILGMFGVGSSGRGGSGSSQSSVYTSPRAGDDFGTQNADNGDQSEYTGDNAEGSSGSDWFEDGI